MPLSLTMALNTAVPGRSASPWPDIRGNIKLPDNSATRDLAAAIHFQSAGSIVASMQGVTNPGRLREWFFMLFPGRSTEQDWENFKVGYMRGLWETAQELAVPVELPGALNIFEKLTASGFMTLAYISGHAAGLELLDVYCELQPIPSGGAS
jgi:hypothetical protein